MILVRVSPKGYILIPKKLRERYGVKPGGKVQLIEDAGRLIVKPAPEDPIEAACGFLEGDFSLTEDLLKEHQKELKNEKADRF
ncbi:AbrB/MazE/SpoVT family DNA-binding domain-containing protein [Methanosarcinales archaeon]|nr:MAG: AbrB/MazE/SpoVT family DNA-binding domain-containing protein [Methanosarcinales archaeon]